MSGKDRVFHAARCAPRAFTLVELLTVVGIIAVLIAVLLPMLSVVQRAAMQTRCASNLRQIGQAIVLYSADNAEWVPRDCTLSRPDREPWPILLGKYLGAPGMSLTDLPQAKVFQCPSHPLDGLPTGYVINAFAFETAPTWAPDGPVRISRVGRSADVAWVMDAADNFPAGPVGPVDKIFRVEFHDVYDPVQLPSGERHRISDDRHRGRANVLFLDAHVSTVQSGGFSLDMFNDHLIKRATTAPSVTSLSP